MKKFIGAQFKRRFRNKKFLIWIIIMPLILMCFLNSIGGGENISASVAVVDEDNTLRSNLAVATLENEERLKIEEIDSLENGKQMIKRGDIEGLVRIPKGFSEHLKEIQQGNHSDQLALDVYYPEGEDEDIYGLILDGISSKINEYFIEEKIERPVILQHESIDVREWGFSDLLFPAGMILVILHLGLFASSNTASSLTENNTYKSLKMLPVTQNYPVFGMIITDSLFTTLGVLIALFSGIILFGTSISFISFIGILIIILISSLMLSFLGCSVGYISSNQISAQGISFIFVFPFIFFSYSYLFSNLFPDYFSQISKFLPTYPIVNQFETILFHEISLYNFVVKLSLLFIWLIVIMTAFMIILKKVK